MTERYGTSSVLARPRFNAQKRVSQNKRTSIYFDDTLVQFYVMILRLLLLFPLAQAKP
jgi:hypothetical protein